MDECDDGAGAGRIGVESVRVKSLKVRCPLCGDNRLKVTAVYTHGGLKLETFEGVRVLCVGKPDVPGVCWKSKTFPSHDHLIRYIHSMNPVTIRRLYQERN